MAVGFDRLLDGRQESLHCGQFLRKPRLHGGMSVVSCRLVFGSKTRRRHDVWTRRDCCASPERAVSLRGSTRRLCVHFERAVFRRRRVRFGRDIPLRRAAKIRTRRQSISDRKRFLGDRSIDRNDRRVD